MLRKAFTLVELLVVIAIVGLLSTVAVAAFSNSRDKAAVARGLQFESSIYHAAGSEAIGMWNFDDGAGTTAVDSSGNDRSATLVNSPTWRCASTNVSYTPSGQGCALNFSGAGSYVSTTVSGVGDGTISLWFNNQGSAAGAVILGKRNTGCFGSAIYINNPPNSNDLRVYNAGPETTIATTKSNQWNHLAVVRTGGGAEANYYLNGTLVLKNAYNLNLNDLIGTIGSTCAGANPFRGYLDNVRMFGMALGAARIKRLYAEEKEKYAS